MTYVPTQKDEDGYHWRKAMQECFKTMIKERDSWETNSLDLEIPVSRQ